MVPIVVKKRKVGQISGIDNDDPSLIGSDGAAVNEPPHKGNIETDLHKNARSQSIPTRRSQATTDELLLSQSSDQSTLLRLQLDDLLEEIRPDHEKIVARLEGTLARLKAILYAIQKRPPQSLSDAQKELKNSGVAIPWPEPAPNKNLNHKFEYLPPTTIEVRGPALALGQASGSPGRVDLAVTLPADVFQPKDFRDHIYFYKRAFFVASFAAAIKSATEGDYEVQFEFQDDISLQPCINIRPGTSAPAEFRKARHEIRIITFAPQNTFPLEKTDITKCCLRTHDDQESTPFYNSSLRIQLAGSSYADILSRTLHTCPSFGDACLLGTVWLNQRGFTSAQSSGGFGTEEWALLMALMLKGGGHKDRPIFSPRFTSLQLFKGVLQMFATRNLSEPLVFGDHSAEIPTSGLPAVYDTSRGVNILYRMTPWSYNLLKLDAVSTLKSLNESLQDNFDAIFIRKSQNSLTRFDQTAIVSIQATRYSLTTSRQFRELYRNITRGLGDRASLVHISSNSRTPWSINKPHSPHSTLRIKIGFILNRENANRVVDRGPSADEKEASAAFREFWGEKAELRRFKDGTISESIVWSDDASGPSILHQILQTLLVKHFEFRPFVLELPGEQFEYDIGLNNAQSSFQKFIETYQSLSATLHSFEDLPLTIRSVSASDEQLRFASVKDPFQTTEPADIIVQFEGSSRWPDDLAAIQRTKIAFLTKIGDLLERSKGSIRTRLSLEHRVSELQNFASLQIGYSNGLYFRLQIQNEREQILLERLLQDKQISGQTRDEAAQSLAIYKRDYVHSPRHTQSIRALCTRLPALSMTIRLMKRWISSHLLSSFFTPEMLELLCAQVFLQPFPWHTPSSPLTAFFRVLVLISKWDWTAEPMIIDLSSGEMASTDLSNINTNFQAWRKIDPAMNNVVLFVASNLDLSGVAWTKGVGDHTNSPQPPKVVATRLSALAQASVEAIDTADARDLDLKSLFISPLSHFDFILHLSQPLVKRHRPKHKANRSSTSSKFKNLQMATQQQIGPQNPGTAYFDPISLYLSDLQSTFPSHICLFFHDDIGGDVIAGLWNPSIVGVKKFRVRAGVSTRPAANEGIARDEAEMEEADDDGNGEETTGSVESNRSGMVAEMATMGEGIIEKVEMLRE